MKAAYALLVVLTVAGCAAVIDDPRRFQAESQHIEREYPVPIHDLYECVIQSDPMVRPQNGWATDSSDTRAFVGIRGALEIRMDAVSKTRTKVRVSGQETTNPFLYPSKWVRTLDGCAGP